MKERIRWALPLVVALLLLAAGCKQAPPAVPLGTTHLSGLEVSGNETDELVVNQTGTGDIVELRDSGTVQWRLADGGAVTVVGTSDHQGNVSDSGGAYTIQDNVLITPTEAVTTTVAAIIRGHSNSSVNVLEVQNYGQTKSFQVSQGGHITTTRTISVGTSASVANGLTVSAGSVSLPAGSVANAALAAGNSYFAIPVHWATQITNTTEEIYRTSIPIASTPISITLSAGAAGGHAAGTARVRVWDDGVSLGEVLETAPSADTYYSHAAALGGSIAANSTLTFEVVTTNYGLTDAQVTLWAYSAHQ